MKNPETDINDELRAEYDLQSLRVRKVGCKRKNFINQTELDAHSDKLENSSDKKETDRKLQA